MTGVIRAGTMAGRLAATAGNGGDGTRTEIAQSEELPQKLIASGLQIGQRLGQESPPSLSIYIYSDSGGSWLKPLYVHSYVAPPPDGTVTVTKRERANMVG